jgi:hypothetical protein
MAVTGDDVSRTARQLRPRPTSGHDAPREVGVKMIYRLDHVGIVVEDLGAAVAFFIELGLELEGEAAVEGAWVDQLVGLDGVRADLAVVGPRTATAGSNCPPSTRRLPPALHRGNR